MMINCNFIKCLEDSFVKYACPEKFQNASLRSIWAADKKLVLSYEYVAAITSSVMWTAIPQYWAEAQTINRLHSYPNTIYGKSESFMELYVVMVEFTHCISTVIKDAFRRDMSLRHWAQRIAHYIPQWYIEEWNSTANIIAVDFYETSGIVDVAIQLNERRFEELHFTQGA